MNKEVSGTTENLLGRVSDRPAFPWEKENLTIGETITVAARQETEEKIAEIDENLLVSTLSVLERVAPRAASWGYNEWLGHSGLKRKRVRHLSLF